MDKAGLQRLLFDFINIGNNRRNYKIQKKIIFGNIKTLEKGKKMTCVSFYISKRSGM
jgi:hypothetical protein